MTSRDCAVAGCRRAWEGPDGEFEVAMEAWRPRRCLVDTQNRMQSILGPALRTHPMKTSGKIGRERINRWIYLNLELRIAGHAFFPSLAVFPVSTVERSFIYCGSAEVPSEPFFRSRSNYTDEHRIQSYSYWVWYQWICSVLHTVSLRTTTHTWSKHVSPISLSIRILG